MKRRSFLLILTLAYFISSFAQGKVKDADPAAAYTSMITTRAEKIVAVLGITDAAKSARVTTLVASQYRNLNDIHAARDTQIRVAKMEVNANKDAVAARVKSLEDEANARLDELHKKYLAGLAKELTEKQIEQVKDGMTYNVAPITYKAYNEEILTLTDKQKEQIMVWLIEAREHAMDAESSDKKHAWFGKYKGRINNYLSAAGYDLKKEGEEWQKRIQASKAARSN